MLEIMTEQPLQILRSVYGYNEFRGEQAAIINHVIAGSDAIVIMPTGSGKSICYQIPAMVRAGVGIVISPLISLMQDQVNALRQLGIRAAMLNSTLSFQAAQQIQNQMLRGELDLVYVAPERLVTENFIQLLKRAKIALFAIDEAHCVSQWGHDFRREYTRLDILHKEFPGVPRIALTATADEATRIDIIKQLELTKARLFITGFDRPNITYQVVQKNNPLSQLLALIQAKHKGDACIVYCLSRRKVEETAAWLNDRGLDALIYHAGLDKSVRERNQDRFLREEGKIMVATVAFGMGIDKPNVRLVAHLDMPKSMEGYYQETGRAGRDGLPAHAWLAYGLADVIMLRQMIAQSQADEHHKRIEHHKLESIIGYCESVACRRQVLLNYFGEQLSVKCGNCDNCLTPKETWDGTIAAQKALSCVYRTGQRFGIAYLCDVLIGKSNERIRHCRHDQISTFGVGKELNKNQWRLVFQQLIATGLLAVDIAGHGGLSLTPESRSVLKGERAVVLWKESLASKSDSGEIKASKISLSKNDNQVLWDQLRDCRIKLATERNVPPYVIFHDASLLEMIQYRPQTLEELSRITGVGAYKLSEFGKRFLEIIHEHTRRYGLPPDLPELPQVREHHRLPANSSTNSASSNGEPKHSETIETTIKLFQQGNTPERIAQLRGLKPETIYKYLARAIERGDLDFRKVVNLPDEEITKIEECFRSLPDESQHFLTPVYQALEGKYSFDILRCVRAGVKQNYQLSSKQAAEATIS
jgi:ATP-dependent DNA helicase RecQ